MIGDYPLEIFYSLSFLIRIITCNTYLIFCNLHKCFKTVKIFLKTTCFLTN
jgi:hypothetical protein